MQIIKKGKLIVSGDSWTAGSLNSGNYRLWPDYLGSMLNMDVFNVGAGGRGNEFIYNNIIDALCREKNTGLAIALWSDPNREVGKILPPSGVPPQTEFNLVRSLRWYNAFQNFCEVNSIPYLQGGAWWTPEKDGTLTMIDSHIFYKMNEETFIGWPMATEIGGFTFHDKIGDDLRISEEDPHPNTEGHKLIAELLYNFYVKKYV